MSTSAPRLWLQCLIIIAVGLFVYQFAPMGSYMPIDDFTLTYKNPIVTNFDIPKAFSTFDPELYIPLTLLSYQIEYAFAGNSPGVFHATNVILHCLNAVLVLLLVRFFHRRWIVPFLTAVLFAVHPLNTEAVMWISARKDLLCAFFFLGSLCTYCRFRMTEKKMLYYGSLALFTLALLSKVTAVMLPLILMIIDDILEVKPYKNERLSKVPYALLALVFLFIGMLRKMISIDVLSYGESILLAIKGITFYLIKLIAPVHLSLFYEQITPVSLWQPDFFVPVLLFIALCSIVLTSRHIGKLFAFGVMWYGIALLPNLANTMKGGTFAIFFASDRYAYLPSIGVLLLFAAAALWLYEKMQRQYAWSIPLTVMIGISIYGITAHQYSVLWLTPKSYIERGLTLYPQTFFYPATLGGLALQEDNTSEALRHLRKASTLEPRYRGTQYHLAIALLQNEKVDASIAVLKRILATHTSDPHIYNTLAYAYFQKQNLSIAMQYIEMSLNLEPTGNAKAHYVAGLLHHAKGDIKRAEQEYRTSLAIDNSALQPKVDLARLLRDA